MGDGWTDSEFRKCAQGEGSGHTNFEHGSGFVRTTDELQERFFFGCLTALGRRKSAAKVLSGRGDPAD